jgi:hypothetical protein
MAQTQKNTTSILRINLYGNRKIKSFDNIFRNILNFVFQVWTGYRRTPAFGGLIISKGRLLFYFSLRG